MSLANYAGFIYPIGNTDGEASTGMQIYQQPEDAWKANAYQGGVCSGVGFGLSFRLYFIER